MLKVVLAAPKDVRLEALNASMNGLEGRSPEGKALVRLRMAGICGSDLAAYRGVSPLFRYPSVLGHELVVDVLNAPDRPELEGKRAVVEPLVACGRCRSCRLGRYNCCADLKVMGVHIDGGLQDQWLVDVNRLYPVSDNLTDEAAVLAEPTSIAYRAVQRSQIEPGRIAVVFGAGTIGLLIAYLLVKARGCRTFVVDLDSWRLERARSAGAIPLDGNKPEEIATIVKDSTAGEMADVVFEATGSASATRMATDLVAYAGRIVLIGWNQGPVEFDTVTLMRKEAEVFGSRNSTGAFPAVLRLLEDGVVNPADLITQRVSMHETEKALEMLDKGDEPALKVVIDGSRTA